MLLARTAAAMTLKFPPLGLGPKHSAHLLLYLVRPQLGPAMLLEEGARPLVPANSGDLQVGVMASAA